MRLWHCRPTRQGRDANWAVRRWCSPCAIRLQVRPDEEQEGHGGRREEIALRWSRPATAAPSCRAGPGRRHRQRHGLTKDLGNLPPNVCTPTYLAKTARNWAKDFKMAVEVLDRKQIEALKMLSFLSVTNGTVEPPKFIVLKHMGGKPKDAPVVLVGKGITFDSGGISIKPGANMDEMKYDMCGAGSVLGTMRAIGEMGLKLNVIAVIPATENMPSGRPRVRATSSRRCRA
jgi:leucyl aminopeptidase